MAKQRSKSTHFWEDTYVLNLDPIEKLLMGYLLDNPMVSILGIYELHPRRMAFDTGIDADMVKKVLQRFVDDKKIVLIDGGWICLLNRPKHIPTRGNVDNPTAKGIVREFKELPEHIKSKIPAEFYKNATLYWGSDMIAAWAIDAPSDFLDAP